MGVGKGDSSINSHLDALNTEQFPLKSRITPEILQIAQAFKVKIIEAPLNPRSIIWGPPPVGWIKSNSDGSLSDDRGGYGALLRDCSAQFIIGSAVQGLSQLEEWRITHIFKEGNSPADILASRRQSRGEDFILPHQVWPKLKEALEANKAGTTFTRN
ncbi:hypothetical protein QJS10_CPA01g01382 [Acorus calamus]|uniref:RNase H type-1 domain-containing protein n=1 Tax=Acorus calamus TaxID=4465 RepID=A0AAV9FI65_ACOCL|nr:hypothetical protein QJS10_CPA01g01382 [Acorus calamus]